MRLVTRKIWRAFPELDRFDDEQCRRFVDAANRRIRWRVFRWVLVTVAVITGLCSTYLVLLAEDRAVDWGWLSEPTIKHLLQRTKWLNTDWALGLILVWHFVLAAFLGAVTRDLLLRLRVRRVVRTRGVCFACHYPLLGLPVEANLKVTCPECGHRTEVDPSLGELAPGEDGRPRFVPGAELIRRSDPTRFYRAAVKTLKWGAIAVAALILVAGVALGIYEVQLRRQTARASAMPLGQQQLADLMLSVQPATPADSNAPNAFDLLVELESVFKDAEKRIWPAGRPEHAKGTTAVIQLDPSYLYKPSDPLGDPVAFAETSEGIHQARLMVAELERSGAYARFFELAQAPRREPKPVYTAGAPLFAVLLPELAKLRAAANWCGARAAIAAERNDSKAVEESLRTGFALARMADGIPWLFGRLVGSGIEDEILKRARAVLMDSPDARMIDAVERALYAEPPPPQTWIAFEAERISVIDFARWVFADTSNTRWGKYNPRFDSLYGATVGRSTMPGAGNQRLGSLEENLAGLNAAMDAVVARARQPRPARPPAVAPATTGLAIVDTYSGNGWHEHFFAAVDRIEMELAGLEIMVAIERFRLQTGAIPQSLAELAPRFINTVPSDPYTGAPFGYHLVDPASDVEMRHYLLYSIGIDNTDNRGTSAQFPIDALMPNRLPGIDYIINQGNR